MATTKAATVKTTSKKTAADVQKMNSKERLWADLDNKYGQQREESNRAYDKSYSQTGQEMLKRGMQRSSYGAQTQANVLTEKSRAADQIYENQIAAYAEGLNDLEWREAQERIEQSKIAAQYAQIAANKEIAEKQLAYQKEQAELARAFTTSEREATQAYNTSEREAQYGWQSQENAYNRAFQTSEREAQQNWQSYENSLSREYNTSERVAQQDWQSQENAYNRAFTTSERIAQQNWQGEQNALDREYQRERAAVADAQWEKQYQQSLHEFNTQMEYQRERAGVSDAQWEKQYELSRAQFDAQMAENKRQFDAEFGLKSAAATPAASSATTGNPKPDNNRDWFDELGDTDFSKKYQTSTKTTRNTSGNSIFSALKKKTGA